MRALITGMGGFVGSHLAARLARDGWDVVGTVRPGSTGDRLRGLDAAVLPVDLADEEATRRLGRSTGPDVAFLVAAARASATPDERGRTTAVNATSVTWLLEELPERCRTVVRVGSSTEYAATDGPMEESTPVRPRGFFGATKAAGSALLSLAGRARGRRTAVLRAFQVYGPHDHRHRLVPAALRAARSGERLPLTRPGLRRDWVYVADVVEACVGVAGADGLPSELVLNIGTGRQTANEDLVALVADVAGRPVAVDGGAYPDREWDTESWVCDPARARELLGWAPAVPLREGLRRCWQAEGG